MRDSILVYRNSNPNSSKNNKDFNRLHKTHSHFS